ncbi:MAG: 30S ribosomal protein S6 [Sandaracinaceae bacterium]|nr:30S ribosomal protein S6 [Sandaracinaceae bacterium]
MPVATQQIAREYETIYIMRPSVDPDDADKIATRMTEVVDRLKGKMIKVDNWGKRKLAYPINKATRGVFVYFKYIGFGDMVAEIERNLRMQDTVVRFQTIMTNDEEVSLDVKVDPEEVKFRRLEVTEEEPELGIEHRLGMVEMPRGERARTEDDMDGFDEEGLDDDDDVVAPVTALLSEKE